MPYQIILSSDRGSFTDYGGSSVLGYVACMPSRLVPRLFMDRFFTPKVPLKGDNAAYAPYALRKVEAILSNSGFDVTVVPPEKIEKYIKDAKILGITVHDPFGLNPVSAKLSFIFGGGPTWTAQFFSEFGEKVSKLKKKYNFKVIAGGPGSWELSLRKPDWVDVVFLGEAEVDLPIIAKKIIDGEDVPPIVKGRNAKIEEIPTIKNPARLGEVQITRGCPRGCKFCSVTPETFRSIPLDQIKKEVEVNLKGGWRRVEFITDDVMLYGSSKLRTNHDAIVKLFTEVMNMGVDGIWFPHISAPAVRESPKTVKAIAEIARYDVDRAAAPVVGLETGSLKILEKYMTAKAFPWTPREWKDVILDATAIMNDNYIYPCYTMTIGYPEEGEKDVEESINPVQSIIDHKFTAWIFPLPVIPISTTYISKNPYPKPETLPQNYWDLLYISWHYDLKVTRDLIPILTGGIKNKLVRKFVQIMIDKIFSNIDYIFLQLKNTKGEFSKTFSQINLNNTLGVIKSIYWLIRITAKPQ
ncbi:B12-binding domain-containing radical SAM protein [Acidianus ambivalens]|uniref:Radical SAM protein n=1 Tax=Acidianus ambivalens TaxID=2283 RepID=A0A650CV53_ACIAM|nr:radical SAM protein [Acidianus ambivalens]MQL55781.1 radical SAM protein [Acidianus ambivalens]QGR21648.1 radical SAM protein [Acidianus ambivalens]